MFTLGCLVAVAAALVALARWLLLNSARASPSCRQPAARGYIIEHVSSHAHLGPGLLTNAAAHQRQGPALLPPACSTPIASFENNAADMLQACTVLPGQLLVAQQRKLGRHQSGKVASSGCNPTALRRQPCIPVFNA